MLLLRQSRLLRRQMWRRARSKPDLRRIVLHVGAHKTGTTYIQQTLEANRARLPLAFETVTRRHRHLHQLTLLAAGIRTDADFQECRAKLAEHTKAMANRFSRVENLLITHEGLAGLMPGRENFKGLYPMAHRILPEIVQGFEQSGAQVRVVMYQREFRDWQASLYRYRFRQTPERQYHPTRFAERAGLPGNWHDFTSRLTDALPKDCLQVVSYESDRESGLLGRSLYETLGLSSSEISSLRRLPPQNVSRPETLHDRQFEA